MKIIMEFNLPEEWDECQNAQHGSKWKYIVYEIMERILRNTIKYNHKGYTPDTIVALEDIRLQILEELDVKGLNLYDT
jgi:hypothetical protein